MDRDKNLEICFEIKPSKPFDKFNISYALVYRSSNYDLSKDELMRASLRPEHLVLDDKFIYVKSREIAEPKDEMNILKLNYLFSGNHI
jgi:hypothetical protein